MSKRVDALRRSLVVALSATAFGAAFLASEANAQGSPPRPSEKVRFLLDFTPYGKHAFFYASLDKGFWQEVGLDVTILKGEGSSATVAAYAAGAADFAFADTSSVIIARPKGAKLKVVAMIHDKALYGIGTLKRTGIKGPADLQGKRVGSSAGDAARTIFPAVAQLNRVDQSKVQWVTMTPPARIGSLLAGQVDAVAMFATESPTFSAKAREAGEGWDEFLYADFGLDIYSSGLLARDDLVESKPDLVNRFVAATMKGVAWAVENPDEALRIFLKHNPAVDPEQARDHFRMAVRHLMTDTAKQKGVGYMEADKMQRTVDVVGTYFDAKGIKPEDIYTGRFLPRIMATEKAF
jgi:NitT/TauT family transport system substrate-binding protein